MSVDNFSCYTVCFIFTISPAILLSFGVFDEVVFGIDFCRLSWLQLAPVMHVLTRYTVYTQYEPRVANQVGSLLELWDTRTPVKELLLVIKGTDLT